MTLKQSIQNFCNNNRNHPNGDVQHMVWKIENQPLTEGAILDGMLEAQIIIDQYKIEEFLKSWDKYHQVEDFENKIHHDSDLEIKGDRDELVEKFETLVKKLIKDLEENFPEINDDHINAFNKAHSNLVDNQRQLKHMKTRYEFLQFSVADDVYFTIVDLFKVITPTKTKTITH